MPKTALAIVAALLSALPALAQDVEEDNGPATIGQLSGRGYEIKAAAPNGSRYVVFMQKDKSVYACEFVNTTTTQCRQVN